MDFFGNVHKITRVETHKEGEDSDVIWRVLIKGEDRHSLTLVFDEEPTEYPLGFPVQVKIKITQTTLNSEAT